MLWVLLLAVYLLTFIICFDQAEVVSGAMFSRALLLAVVTYIVVMLLVAGAD